MRLVLKDLPSPSKATMSKLASEKNADYDDPERKDPEAQIKESSDAAMMAKMGYKQELKRDLTLLQVSLIRCLSALLTPL